MCVSSHVFMFVCACVFVCRLNEGWTTFLERKIIARLYGEQERHLRAIGKPVEPPTLYSSPFASFSQEVSRLLEKL